jgi:CRP-like cAMP-binding protein
VTRRPPSLSELKLFRQALGQLGVSSRSAEQYLRKTAAKRNTILMSAGDDPDDSGFVVSGVIREYYLLDDGTERTRGFALPGDSFGSLADALCRRPSRVFVRAETDSVVLQIKWSFIELLAATSLEWERLTHSIISAVVLAKVDPRV